MAPDLNQIPLPQVEYEELATMLGDHQVFRVRQGKLIQNLLEQINEMQKEIDRLRGNNGKLGEPGPRDTIRRVPLGVQGPGRGLGDDVPERPNDAPDGVDQVGPGQ